MLLRKGRGVIMTKLNEKIIDKIKKLLSLATSDNEHEARMAAEKANEILLRHNISMSQVEASEEDFENTILEEKSRLSVEDKFVQSIVSRFFFVKFIHNHGHKKVVLNILGDLTNVQIGTYTYQFLQRKFKELWLEYKRKTDCGCSAKQSYYYGLYTGLIHQLDIQRTKIVQEKESNSTALVLVNNALSKYLKEQYPNARILGGSRTIPTNDRNAVTAGTTDGKNIRIQRGVESKGEQIKYLK